MKPSVALLFAVAVLFLVSQMVGEDSQISDIAQMDDNRLRDASAAVGNMDGFTDEADLRLLPKEEQGDRAKDSKGKGKKTARAGRLARTAEQPTATGWAEQGKFGAATAIQPFDPGGSSDDDDDDVNAAPADRPRVVKISDATEPTD